VTIAKSITPVFAPGNKVIPGNGFEIVQNSSQLKRYRRIAVIGYRTRAVHHSKSRAHNGALILAYGVGNGQAWADCAKAAANQASPKVIAIRMKSEERTKSHSPGDDE